MFHCIGKPCKQQYAHIKQDCTLIKEEVLPKYTGDITVLHIQLTKCIGLSHLSSAQRGNTVEKSCNIRIVYSVPYADIRFIGFCYPV